jgi:hypothetical protein
MMMMMISCFGRGSRINLCEGANCFGVCSKDCTVWLVV